MSKSTGTFAKLVSMKTCEQSFATTKTGNLMTVNPGESAAEALYLAGDLMEGMSLLCDRLYESFNHHGDPVNLCELRAISHLAETASALTRAAGRSMAVGGAE